MSVESSCVSSYYVWSHERLYTLPASCFVSTPRRPTSTTGFDLRCWIDHGQYDLGETIDYDGRFCGRMPEPYVARFNESVAWFLCFELRGDMGDEYNDNVFDHQCTPNCTQLLMEVPERLYLQQGHKYHTWGNAATGDFSPLEWAPVCTRVSPNRVPGVGPDASLDAAHRMFMLCVRAHPRRPPFAAYTHEGMPATREAGYTYDTHCDVAETDGRDYKLFSSMGVLQLPSDVRLWGAYLKERKAKAASTGEGATRQCDRWNFFVNEDVAHCIVDHCVDCLPIVPTAAPRGRTDHDTTIVRIAVKHAVAIRAVCKQLRDTVDIAMHIRLRSLACAVADVVGDGRSTSFNDLYTVRARLSGLRLCPCKLMCMYANGGRWQTLGSDYSERNWANYLAQARISDVPDSRRTF